jgi:hypothetical protein
MDDAGNGLERFETLRDQILELLGKLVLLVRDPLRPGGGPPPGHPGGRTFLADAAFGGDG